MRVKTVVKLLTWTTLVYLAALLVLRVRLRTNDFNAINDEAARSGNNTHPSSHFLFYLKDNNSSLNYSNYKDQLHTAYITEEIKRKELNEEEYFQLRKVQVNPIDEPVIVENRQLCNQNVEVPYLLAVIPSIPANSKMRDVIRETIGSYVSGEFAKQLRREHNVTVKLLFVIGNGPNQSVDDLVQKENKIHRDILQADFTDTYKNLTKKMLIAFKWIATYCPTVDYVIKVDTDVFVNIPVLIPTLISKTTDPNGTILGHIYSSGPVRRDGNWKVTQEEYPFKKYPSYASGNAYIISGHILPRLVHAAKYFPYIPIEDAFITGCLARVIGAKLVKFPGFSQWLDKRPEPCLFFKQHKVTGTKITAELWQQLWDVQNNYLDKCAKTSR